MLKRIKKQTSLRLNMILTKSLLENSKVGTSLVAQRLRIHLPVQKDIYSNPGPGRSHMLPIN